VSSVIAQHAEQNAEREARGESLPRSGSLLPVLIEPLSTCVYKPDQQGSRKRLEPGRGDPGPEW
jgi:hypothetical protein